MRTSMTSINHHFGDLNEVAPFMDVAIVGMLMTAVNAFFNFRCANLGNFALPQ